MADTIYDRFVTLSVVCCAHWNSE